MYAADEYLNWAYLTIKELFGIRFIYFLISQLIFVLISGIRFIYNSRLWPNFKNIMMTTSQIKFKTMMILRWRRYHAYVSKPNHSSIAINKALCQDQRYPNICIYKQYSLNDKIVQATATHLPMEKSMVEKRLFLDLEKVQSCCWVFNF